MTTLTISNDSGQLTVAVDGGEPQPIQNAEDACQVVEQTFSQPQSDALPPKGISTEGAEEAGSFEGGFSGIRGAGLNG